MVKTIGVAARQQIQKLVMGKVHIGIFVRVQPKGRQSRSRMEELGYRLDE